jgi:serine/threonine protein kinase
MPGSAAVANDQDSREFRGTPRYRVERTLGRGGMGTVYQIWDAERGLELALKTLHSADPTWLVQFKNEFRLVADLAHRNIARLYDLETHDGQWFFTMELLHGADLLGFVRRTGDGAAALAQGSAPVHAPPASNPGSAGPTAPLATPAAKGAATASSPGAATAPTLTASQATPWQPGRASAPRHDRPFAEQVDEHRLREMLFQLASALDALHARGVVHRDVKPSNVLVDGTGRLVLLDFGIAAAVPLPGATIDRRVIGTPAFMAPEQIRGEPVGPAADWYALGGLLFCALTGGRPFTGSTAEMLTAKQAGAHPGAASLRTPGVPDDLDWLCSSLLQPRAEDRPDATEVLQLLRSAAHHVPTGSPRRAEVFVGRGEQRRWLAAALHDSRDAGVCVALRGPSGIGKSALVHEFLRTDAAAATILAGRCHERENVPFKALDALVDQLAQLLAALPPAERDALLPDEAALIGRLFPVLAPLTTGPRQEERAGRTPAQARRHGFLVLRQLLERLATRQALVLVVDDLQWADADSLDLLAVLLGGEGACPCALFLLVMRDDGAAVGAADALLAGLPAARVRRLTLGGLDAAEQDQLLRAIGGQPAHVTEETAGNPLLITELARFAARHGTRTAAPLTFREALVSRLEELSAMPRALLTLAAVAGEPVPLSVLAAAGEHDLLRGEDALRTLRAEQLVRIVQPGADPWIAAAHDQIRTVVSEVLPPERRRDEHRALAGALERSRHGRPEALARHWLAAGEPAAASAHFQRAAEHAARQLAFARAVEFYGQALTHGDLSAPARAGLLQQCADALVHAGRITAAAEHYRRAAELTDRADLRQELLRRTAEEYLRSGQIEPGRELLRQVLREERVLLPRRRAGVVALLLREWATLVIRRYRPSRRRRHRISSARNRRLRLLFAASGGLLGADLLRGGALAFRHMREAAWAGDDEALGYGLSLTVISLSSRGAPEAPRTTELMGELRALASQTAAPRLRAYVDFAEGVRAMLAGRLRAARAHLGDAARQFAHIPDSKFELLNCHQYRFACSWILGDFAPIASELGGFVAEAEQSEDQLARAVFFAQQPYRCLISDQPEAARQWLARALASCPVEPGIRHFGYVAQSLFLLNYLGRGAEALAFAGAWERKLQRALVFNTLPGRAMFYARVGVAALQADRPAVTRRAHRRLAAAGPQWGGPARAYLRAALARRDGASKQHYRRLLEAAIATAESAEQGFWTHAVRYRLGCAAADRGLIEAALSWAGEQQIRAPERWFDAFAPP